MQHPRHLRIADYTYTLPEDRIARYPLPERDASKLLVYRDGAISTTVYKRLPEQLEPGTMLVFNNTRVVRARLFFQKPTGGQLELFCLEPDERYPDIQAAMQQHGEVYWKCLVGGAAKWKEGIALKCSLPETLGEITAWKVEKNADHFVIRFSWNEALSFAEVLQHAGQLPLPPYMNRAAETPDHERYQTVYAEPEGSVAAPTAGLHFTNELFEALAQQQVSTHFVTLHVGAGTFKPVKSETMDAHEMHAEFLETAIPFLDQLLNRGKNKLICVGTTSLRTVESLYWMGVKTYIDPAITYGALEIKQWDAYELPQEITVEQALFSLKTWIEKNGGGKLVIKTQIIIAPGYRLRIADALITNFHQPQSTLLLLIASIVGDSWKNIYQYALDNDFRFLSYGDGCLLWPTTSPTAPQS